MFTTVTLRLFLKPGDELIPSGNTVKPAEVRALGDKLQAHLARAAVILEKLTADGWEVEQGVHDLIFTRDDIDDEAEAIECLAILGIDEKEVEIDPFGGDDEDDHERPSPLTDAQLDDLQQFLRKKSGLGGN